MVLQKVVAILAEIMGIDNEDISLKTELTGSNGIKPVDVAKLVIECEKKLHISIHDEDVHQFQTVHDLVKYIKNNQSDL